VSFFKSLHSVAEVLRSLLPLDSFIGSFITRTVAVSRGSCCSGRDRKAKALVCEVLFVSTLAAEN
jgi:hypothetical protein